jgi:predicted dehydrogenase
MEELRGTLIGCGYFARNHLHGWGEVEGARIVAVCDLDLARARTYAAEFNIPRAYADAEEMLRAEQPDFVDIVTQPAAHRPLVELAARHGVHVICQKPLAPSLDDARAMVEACRTAGVQFMVHENFRWQTPMRALKEAAAEAGPLFFGRITFRSAVDVYANQPYLATDPRFIIYDLGVHLLDLARFFMGEAAQVYCHIQRINPRIRGEDVATIMLTMRSGATCLVDMSFASRLAEELFPQTLVHLEGVDGSASLGPHYAIAVAGPQGVRRFTAAPHIYPWSAPPAEAVQESVVRIQQHWVACLRAGREPETSGRDTLRTLELVFGAYTSAESGQPYQVAQPE